MATNSEKFHKEKSANSKLKTAIVVEYYKRWVEIMFHAASRASVEPHFAYIDLFAGKGKYSDGSYSTALEVIDYVMKHRRQYRAVETIFNDIHKKSIQSLSKCVDDVCQHISFKYPPKFSIEDVNDGFVEKIMMRRNVPSLLFIDPWGYKGLSLNVIKLGIQNFGCDGLFFFNYNGINRSFQSNKKLLMHMRSLFGDGADELISEVKGLASIEREERIIKYFESEVKKINNAYVTGFRFIMPGRSRTSHYLFHVTTNSKGFEIFKEVIEKLNPDEDGFPLYIFDPNKISDNKKESYSLDLSKYISGNKENLAQNLLDNFKGKSVTFEDICKHHVGRSLFTIKNHRKSLLYLETEEKVKVDDFKPDGQKRKNGTFPDGVKISFL